MKLDLVSSRRRVALLGSLALVSRRDPCLVPAAFAAVEDVENAYNAGERFSGRGANALLKRRADSGLVRFGGGDAQLFKAGEVLDTVRSEDGSAVDISFAFPERWTLAKGPNLDVRDVRTADSAYALVAPLPKGNSNVASLSKAFFTDLIFSATGKYGSYGAVDDFSVSKWELVSLNAPAGAAQEYRRFELKFNALTYNANTVERRALVSATSLGDSVVLVVAGCLGTRYKAATDDLRSVQQSFRASTTSRRFTSASQ